MKIEIHIRKDMAGRPWQIDIDGDMLGQFDTWPEVIEVLTRLPAAARTA